MAFFAAGSPGGPGGRPEAGEALREAVAFGALAAGREEGLGPPGPGDGLAVRLRFRLAEGADGALGEMAGEVLGALGGALWQDEAQVVVLVASKTWAGEGERPGVHIEVRRLPGARPGQQAMSEAAGDGSGDPGGGRGAEGPRGARRGPREAEDRRIACGLGLKANLPVRAARAFLEDLLRQRAARERR